MAQMEVNVRLKELRKSCKLTQEQMAKYLDVDQTLITKFENGTRAMSVTMIDQICSLFGCTFGNTPTKKVERLLEKLEK